MPAIMDDPSAPTIHRVSGVEPFPDPAQQPPALPPSIAPRQVTLRDRQTTATIVPFVSRDQVPDSLLRYLSDQFAKEVEGGDTYPMIDPMPFDRFATYWLQNFAGVMLLGPIADPADVLAADGSRDWSRDCLGSFYIKPNYPGRSSHVCNAGFLVTDASRGRGVGRLMGEAYLDWAPKLGYSYSVFNLVYETNVASCRIWDALGFKRIGRVKGCGNLKSYPDRLVDAIIYGRDLPAPPDGGPGDPNGDGTGAGDPNGTGAGANYNHPGGAQDPLLVSEERFDKIKFYLKHGRYPNGSNRAEKSRLRSAATHYKLLDSDVLMLKGKEVISDPPRQVDIARAAHERLGHTGINKTTAGIAERYHWSRIKETVSDVIRLCPSCKDPSAAGSNGHSNSYIYSNSNNNKTAFHVPAATTVATNTASSGGQGAPGPRRLGSSDNVIDVTPPPATNPDYAAMVVDEEEGGSGLGDQGDAGAGAGSMGSAAAAAGPTPPYVGPHDIASLLNPVQPPPPPPLSHGDVAAAGVESYSDGGFYGEHPYHPYHIRPQSGLEPSRQHHHEEHRSLVVDAAALAGGSGGAGNYLPIDPQLTMQDGIEGEEAAAAAAERASSARLIPTPPPASSLHLRRRRGDADAQVGDVDRDLDMLMGGDAVGIGSVDEDDDDDGDDVMGEDEDFAVLAAATAEAAEGADSDSSSRSHSATRGGGLPRPMRSNIHELVFDTG